MPGFISGVGVSVGKVFSVGVADGGNQIMVEVGSGVTDGRGGAVGGIESAGRQAVNSVNPIIRSETIILCMML
ncbi:MAG TPA: hypothetical protein DCX53_00460 [Anaerolineae bacterium]|nr:hypothetical protein [Anaerolineae bacterium]